MLLLAGLALAAACPALPALHDDDNSVTILAQNLKFIATGGQKAERAELLADHLRRDGEIDLLLLAEARALEPLRTAMPDWCFYTQAGEPSSYRWRLGDSTPGGLVLGVRNRDGGLIRALGEAAGKVYRSRAVSLAEGFLGRAVGFEKGWATAEIDGTQLVWTHTQASYASSPLRGAGGPGRGRAGQLAELADHLSAGSGPTLVTGDLNVLDGAGGNEELLAAGAADARTLDAFSSRTGIHFAADRAPCHDGSFLGTLTGLAEGAFASAAFDRVGTNAAFDHAHPGTELRCETIGVEGLSLSDHRGVRVSAPFPIVAPGF